MENFIFGAIQIITFTEKIMLGLRKHVINRYNYGIFSKINKPVQNFTKLFLAHLSHSDKVSFCDRSSSVVRPLTIDLNDNSF